MLTRLSIRTVKKRAFLYFADHIRNGISPDTVGFDKYFQEFSGIILKGRRTLRNIFLKKTSIS
jgi:hypothetical protein